MVDYYRRWGGASDRSRAISNDLLRKNGPVQTVLIIITHAADCNALISSLAGKPVLLDISTASLTMAVRRDRVKKSVSPGSDRTATSPPVSFFPSSVSSQEDRSGSHEYSLQFIASSDHLRAGVNPSQFASLSSPTEDANKDAEDDLVPNFGDLRPVSDEFSHSDLLADQSGWTKQLPQRTLSQLGLWGSAPSLEDRDAASRRRWTVTEQKL